MGVFSMEKHFKKKHLNAVLVSSIIITTLIVSVSALPTYTYSDPADDIYCLSALEYILLVGEMDMPDSISDISDVLDDIISDSDPSTGPDCIDMIEVEIRVLDPNSTMIITMEGNIADCEYVQIFVWGNCSGEAFGMNAIYSSGNMGMDEEESFSFTVDGETNETEGSISGAEISWDFPTDSYPFDEDCSLLIVAMTFQGDPAEWEDMTICFDVFPNEAFGDGGNGGSYEGWDPITEFFDTISSIIFWFMCGRMAYIYFMIILIFIAKIMMDRKNQYVRYSGMGLMGVSIWSMIWYTLEINLLGDPLFGWSIPSYMDLVIMVSLIAFALIQFANNFNFLDDNIWLLTLAFSLSLSETFLYLTPLYYYFCRGDVIIALVVQIIVFIVAIVGMYITEKYSKKRLK